MRNRTPGRRAGGAALAALTGATVVLVAAPASAAPRCFGRPATIVGSDDPRNFDELIGTPGPDVIVARDGDDDIDGRGGADRICGGDGFDLIRGRGGNDRIAGGRGGDTTYGGPGVDRIDGGSGSTDAMFGGSGDDLIHGGSGNFDSMIGGRGDDLTDGGPGLDTAEFWDSPGPVEADLETDLVTGLGRDRIPNVEGIVGSNFDDVLVGDDRSNLLVGQEGDDEIDARGSGTLAGLDSDMLDGGPGDDDLNGGDGDDVVGFDDSRDGVVVNLETGTATGWGADELTSIEAVIGSTNDDTLVGDASDNSFVGGPGDDTIEGGGGMDEAAYFDAREPVTIDLVTGVANGWGADTLSGIEAVTGSAGDDIIGGDDEPNRLFGGSGNDSLFGAGGDDLLFGAAGTDELDGGEGDDACDGESEVACESEIPPGFSLAGRWLLLWDHASAIQRRAASTSLD